MTLNIDTITGSIEPDYPEKVAFLPRRKSMFMLDGIDITANRLFGPPPRNLTYVCIWEIVLGRFKACLNASDALVLASAGNAFRVNFADILNAPAADYMPPLYPDLTFLKVALTSCDVVWKLGEAALQVSLPDGFSLDNNDLGGQDYRKLTSVRLPHLTAKAFLTQAESPVWLEVGSLSTDLYLDMYSLPYGWQKNAEAQAQFVEEQDRKTGRARRMFDILREADGNRKGNQMHKSGVYLPQPSISGFDRYYRRRQTKFNAQKDTATSFDDIAEQSSESDQGFTLSKHVSSEDQFVAAHFSRRRPAAMEDDENMSSGDESDDEDLTERSDSDWEDSCEQTSAIPTTNVHVPRH
ncbi:hypothetical protein MPER_08900 [Moniliophthora perniciosa FA553]|nr:hypothetical protein MPER_08900 [Moniliophthora perniciosa FA553]